MQIIVSDTWLKACGKSHLSGKPLEVKSIRDFGRRGKFYTVIIPNRNISLEYTWEVWDIRGITIV